MSATGFPVAAIEAATADIKALLRIAGEGEDAAIGRAANSALALGERFLGVALIARTHRATIGTGGGWRMLPAAPVRTIGSVTGLPADGPGIALAPGEHAIDIDARGDGWVRVMRPGAAGRVQVDYVAGLAERYDELPEPVREGVIRLAAHLIEARDEQAAPPALVSALWRPFRRIRLAPAERGE